MAGRTPSSRGGAAGGPRLGKTDPRTLVRRATRHHQAPRSSRWWGGGAHPASGGSRGGGNGQGSAAERVVRFLAAIAFLCGVASFAGSSVFDIQSVEVAGNQAVPAPDILAQAGVQAGTSAFTVNAYRIRGRLRRDPRIADVAVGLAFPHRVRITVRERPPATALRLPAGYMLLSADGVALEAAGVPGALPVLTVDRLDPAALQAGTGVSSPDVRLGAEVAGSLPTDLRPDVAAIRIDRAGETILYTRDNIAVRAGAPEGLHDRIARIPDVLAAVRSQGLRVEYVDLRFPGSVIVKPAGAPAGTGASPNGRAGPYGSRRAG